MRALIAGTGALPGVLARAADTPPLICALAGFEPDDIAPDLVFRLETLGSLLADLRARGVSEVCFAGALRRPDIDPALIDTATAPLVPVLQKALEQGDDGALRAVLGIFENAGLTVIGAHDVCPDLRVHAGVLTRAAPDPAAKRDAARADEIARALAVADLGQACVVHRGQALAIEGVFGTDWMLASLATRPDGPGGLFFKAPKPGQDLRVDMPTIGPGTVRLAAAAGLDGIVIAANGVLVLDRAEVVALCDAADLFLWSREASGA